MKIVKGNDDNERQISEGPKYNPALKYSRTPQDKFELTGQQFGTILNALRAILNTPEAAKIILAQQANEAIESIIAEAVEQGIVKESTNQEN